MDAYTREQIGGLALVGRMVAREGKRDELLQLLEEAVAVCGEHEPDGALSATFHVSPASPDLVVLYEHYPSRASLDEHLANYERIPVYGEGRARLRDLLAKPAEIVEAVTPVARFSRKLPVAELVRRILRAEAERDLDAYAACLAADVEVWINGQLRANSREAQRSVTAATLAAFPDWERETLSLIEMGNLAALRWSGSGTHRGTWTGIPASGNRVDFHGTSWAEVAGGLITRIWIDMDMAGPLRQMTATGTSQ